MNLKLPLLFPADSGAGAAVAPHPSASPAMPPVTRLGDLTSSNPAPAPDDKGGGNQFEGLDSLFEPSKPSTQQKPAAPPDDRKPPQAKPDDQVKPDDKQADDKKPDNDQPIEDDEPEDDLEASLRGKKVEAKKPEDKKPDDKKDIKKDDEDPSAKYRTNPELRSAFKTAIEKNKTLASEVTDLRNKVKELEGGGPNAEQVEALTKQLQEATKRNDELEQNLRITDYRKSKEYADKYQQPINGLVDEVKQLMPMLKVIVPAAEEGGQPTRRPATFDDFVALFHADPGDVDQKAVDMFGPSAARVITKLDQLKNLDRMAHEANQNSGKLAKEHHERTLAEKTARTEKAQMSFRQTIAEIEEKHPNIFGAKVEDSKEKEILSKGLGLIDEIYKNGAKMEPEQRGRMDAFLRMRAGAYPLLMHRMKKLQSELEAKEKTISELRETDPKLRPDGKAGGGGGDKKREGDLVDGIDDIPLR